MKIQLTEIHSQLIKPLVDQKREADNKLTEALLLIVGRPFSQYKIENGELEVELVEDKPIEEPK